MDYQSQIGREYGFFEIPAPHSGPVVVNRLGLKCIWLTNAKADNSAKREEGVYIGLSPNVKGIFYRNAIISDAICSEDNIDDKTPALSPHKSIEDLRKDGVVGVFMPVCE